MAKKTPKKEVKKAVKTPKVPAVKLVSFTITAIIPTEPYGNIQPAITVQAANIEDAKAVVLPHIDALMAKYSMNAPKVSGITTKAPETPAAKVQTTPAAKALENKAPEAPKKEEKPAEEASVPYQKAQNAIKTAYSLKALELISDQIIFSKKLHEGEKLRLQPLVAAKKAELTK